MREKKVFVTVQHFRSGGAERVASILINILFEKGYEVAVESDFKNGVNYSLPDGILRYESYKEPVSRWIWKKARYFLRRIRQTRRNVMEFNPDVVVSFLPMTFFETYVSCIGLGKLHIVSDHTSMSRDLGLWTNFIRHYFYSLADSCTILTHKDFQYLRNRVKCKVVVPNPLTFEPEYVPDERKENIVLCVGRVHQWKIKGYDRICRIWGTIYARHPQWRLCIAGEGSDEDVHYLKGLVSAEARESVNFLGQIDDIKSLMGKTKIFALPSRVEGFPMSLIEAMSQSCACVSFAIDNAINEIINDSEDGLIVADGNLDSFRCAIERLIYDTSLRTKIAANASVNVNRFSRSSFCSKWENLIEQ